MNTKYKFLHITVLLLLWAGRINCFASGITEVSDPVADYAMKVGREFTPAKDSLHAEVLKNIRLVRFIADFDSDGIEDIAVSDTYNGAWGNAGGEWQIYLRKRNGKYVHFKETIFFHPLAINIEKIKKGLSKITIYGRHNASEGDLIVYHMTSKGMRTVKCKTIKPVENKADEDDYQQLFGRLYKEQISEVCMLADYLKYNCNWRKGYY